MLYITISELRNRFPGCQIFLPGRGGADPIKKPLAFLPYIHYDVKRRPAKGAA